MTKDFSYLNLNQSITEIDHKYGENVHLISTPYLMSLLTHLCHPSIFQPQMHRLMTAIYDSLFENFINRYISKVSITTPTRMQSFHKEGIYCGEVIDEKTKIVTIDIARAGTFPSHVAFEMFHNFLSHENIRQDHFYMNRKTDEQGRVIGVDVSGSKIGGGVDQAYVLIPDPMGATGGSMCHVVNHYKKNVQGKAKAFIAFHLIVTPEYLKRVKTEHPDLIVFAVRLDRGLSSAEVLNTMPGTHWEKERGLNDIHYIVPGGGGIGELLNNSPK